MKDKLISLRTLTLAIKKGFDLHICKCNGSTLCTCLDLRPTQSLLQRWLREKHFIHTAIMPWDENKWWWQLENLKSYNSPEGCLIITESNCENHTTYEKTLEEAEYAALTTI